jgi:hypothetical protein
MTETNAFLTHQEKIMAQREALQREAKTIPIGTKAETEDDDSYRTDESTGNTGDSDDENDQDDTDEDDDDEFEDRAAKKARP